MIEYAIENYAVDLEFLKQVGYIKKDIEFEDYLDDDDLSNFIDIIYTSTDDKKLVLKKIGAI